ncbi:hypothetical protein NC652_041791 [Populus alba x Populus x berolinensis]|nr:hypothetical protein NC652_041791 [Populus alba x Populus x berolinensis]
MRQNAFCRTRQTYMNKEAYIALMLFSCFSLLSDFWGSSDTYPFGFTYMQSREDGKFKIVPETRTFSFFQVAQPTAKIQKKIVFKITTCVKESIKKAAMGLERERYSFCGLDMNLTKS